MNLNKIKNALIKKQVKLLHSDEKVFAERPQSRGEAFTERTRSGRKANEDVGGQNFETKRMMEDKKLERERKRETEDKRFQRELDAKLQSEKLAAQMEFKKVLYNSKRRGWNAIAY